LGSWEEDVFSQIPEVVSQKMGIGELEDGVEEEVVDHHDD